MLIEIRFNADDDEAEYTYLWEHCYSFKEAYRAIDDLKRIVEEAEREKNELDIH